MSRAQSPPEGAPNSWRFWAVFAALSVTNLLSGLEGTIAAPTLPAIAADLESGDNYVWIVNAYMLTYTAFLPLFGQSASILGRRWPTISAVLLFVLGSGISASATSTLVLIVGRLVQGVGGAGISALTQLIVSDIVSLRDRSKYISIVYAVAGVGSALGPPLGGALVQYSWRWIFWLNLPIGGVALLALLFFLNIGSVEEHRGGVTLARKLATGVDWAGNLVLVCSVTSILIALSWADTRHPWSSWTVILPLALGLLGLVLFLAFEGSPLCAALCPRAPPTMPPRMFANRTSCAGLVATFLASTLSMWRIYLLPVYLQAVLLASPTRAGVLLLPGMLVGMAAAVVAGALLSHLGRYKPIHIGGFAIAILAAGLYVNFDADSSLAEVVVYQILAAAGGGCLLTTMLPSVQASHPPADLEPSTSSWTFMRAFGGVWGLTIPAAIFNARFESSIGRVSDGAVRSDLGGGDAYSHVSAAYITSLEPNVRSEVISAYMAALKVVWIVYLGLTALGAALILFEREIPLSNTLESTHRLKETSPRSAESEEDGLGRVEKAKETNLTTECSTGHDGPNGGKSV